MVFSGSLSTAMSIVGSDFLTKSGFMFAGERLWNKVSGAGGWQPMTRRGGRWTGSSLAVLIVSMAWCIKST